MTMSVFHLQIATPDGSFFDGEAEKLCLRSSSGDLGILAHHIDMVTPVGMGEARVTLPDGTVRKAACIGGLLSVSGNDVRVLATTFEWAEDIDAARAAEAEEKARAMLENKNLPETDLAIAEAKLKRALVRRSVAGHK